MSAPRLCGYVWSHQDARIGTNHMCLSLVGHDGDHVCGSCPATAPRLCVDCGKRPARVGADVCDPCQCAVDDLELDRKNCVADHGPHCGCWRIGAVATALAVVEPAAALEVRR